MYTLLSLLVDSWFKTITFTYTSFKFWSLFKSLNKFQTLIKHLKLNIKTLKLLETSVFWQWCFLLPGSLVLIPAESPLTFAVHLDNIVDIIKLLKNGGAHLDFRAKDGMTALHKAARSKNQVTLLVNEQSLLFLWCLLEYRQFHTSDWSCKEKAKN